MKPEPTSEGSSRPGILKNWISMAGGMIVCGSFFAFILLFVVDSFAKVSNPYVGVLTYLIAPMFLALGTGLIVLGAMWRRFHDKKSGVPIGLLHIDLSQTRDRRRFGLFLGAGALFLLVTAVLSYHSYHYTESTEFCGQACHTVMKPEMVTYQHGSHARVACAECHIGSGATWYVKSKLSGSYQLYATAFNKYPRPVPTPIKNLRPAQETCEKCHWPQKFSGNLDRTYDYFLGDETNTPYSVRLTMKVGGGDPAHGPVGGIHWHMNVANVVEYLAAKRDKSGAWVADETRQSIPYVRVTDRQGAVTEFRTKLFTNDIKTMTGFSLRKMDCMDCHNRPAHKYETPNDSVNLALALGKLDRTMPWIKTNAVFALTLSYTNEPQALESIANVLTERYTNHPSTKQAIAAVQDIYKNNFFPEMKASWAAYPDNIGHKDWTGCFRCHDDEHKSAATKRVLKANDCNACHTILSQGAGPELEQLTPNGQKFKHPGDEISGKCNDCHTGGL